MFRLAEPAPSREGVRLSSTIATLFPPGVVAAELRGAANVAALYPSETLGCDAFGTKRMADFAAGRLCARRALGELGYTAFALRVDADRRPAWPDGLVGSISHTRDFCGVAVAQRADFISIGFDAERCGGVAEELWSTLFTCGESDYLRALSPEDRTLVATLAFSAKEAYYKCHFGITPSWLDFTDVTVTFQEAPARSGSFEIRPVAAGETQAIGRSGRYAIDRDIVLTGVAAMHATPRSES